ncbi:MAG: hypothetical protein Q4D89_06600 [Arachnia propionica]|uniref:hypothetical protein n=1 Tax=Arachnia propionica TaxID=1750 RepID=UPI0026FF54AE|nr:hypothetical protein [Arachnia propionica]
MLLSRGLTRLVLGLTLLLALGLDLALRIDGDGLPPLGQDQGQTSADDQDKDEYQCDHHPGVVPLRRSVVGMPRHLSRLLIPLLVDRLLVALDRLPLRTWTGPLIAAHAAPPTKYEELINCSPE